MTEPLLNASDDEADIDLYRRYVAQQSDDDLCDIVAHLDSDHFPARFAALRRELARRHLPAPPLWPPELSFNRWSPEDEFAEY